MGTFSYKIADQGGQDPRKEEATRPGNEDDASLRTRTGFNKVGRGTDCGSFSQNPVLVRGA